MTIGFLRPAMGCYFIASIDVRDEATYARYLEKWDEVFAKFRGTYIAVDEAPVVLEGSWDYTKVVVISFESRADFDAWYQSPEYKEILRYRLAASRSGAILVRDREPEISR